MRAVSILFRGFFLAVGLVALALTLASCFDSPIQFERQALRHTQEALDHAQRLIPLLQTALWGEAYKQTARIKGELERAISQLDQAMKAWARRGQSPLSYELEASSLLNEVAKSNQAIQDKLNSPETITTAVQNRLVEKAEENAKALEQAIKRLEKAIEKRLGGGE